MLGLSNGIRFALYKTMLSPVLKLSSFLLRGTLLSLLLILWGSFDLHAREQFIFRIDRWVGIPKGLWQNISPAVRNPKINLDETIEKTLSNKNNYLIPTWTPDQIHHILLISHEAMLSAPMSLPAVLKKKIGKNKFAYDFYLGEDLKDAQNVMDILRKLQEEVSEGWKKEEQSEIESTTESIVAQHHETQSNDIDNTIQDQSSSVIRNKRELESAILTLSLPTTTEDAKRDAIQTLSKSINLSDPTSDPRILHALTLALQDPSSQVRNDVFLALVRYRYIPHVFDAFLSALAQEKEDWVKLNAGSHFSDYDSFWDMYPNKLSDIFIAELNDTNRDVRSRALSTLEEVSKNTKDLALKQKIENALNMK